ncbi:sperm mitochondrial-associated cysteine-rich protein [Aotus nancymaae]|uniref:sperm mitochondrial-associated cysteine-rich protein n=1 Tax=Aotus nancymaae TaxID=37293 RepID=UPI0030FE75FE
MCDQQKHSQCCPPKGNQCCPPTTNQSCQPKGNQCCPPTTNQSCQPKGNQCCIRAKCCGLETMPECSPVNKESEPNSPQTQDKGSQIQQRPHSPQYESRLRK